jgi:hypothetical protein
VKKNKKKKVVKLPLFIQKELTNMKIFAYIAFAIEAAEAATSIAALVAAKQPLTGSELQASVEPAIQGAQSAFGFTAPAALVTDICQAAADAINKYVLKS